ncbi:MAG: zf-HC2 domain-containing protein [Betaproteobacteria bacterium]|nr:zf-HC2 domain-containing protein [Betaproteobacteria bacterium]
MKDRTPSECPRTEQLSALVDGELAGAARAEIADHAGSCPLCGAMLRDLGELRVAFRPLAAARPGVDLASLIEQRLAARGRPARPRRYGRWWQAWQLLPSGLAAAGVLTAGVYLGALLTAGAGATALRPAAMAMFDAVAPGGLCVGLPSCYAPGK